MKKFLFFVALLIVPSCVSNQGRKKVEFRRSEGEKKNLTVGFSFRKGNPDFLRFFEAYLEGTGLLKVKPDRYFLPLLEVRNLASGRFKTLEIKIRKLLADKIVQEKYLFKPLQAKNFDPDNLGAANAAIAVVGDDPVKFKDLNAFLNQEFLNFKEGDEAVPEAFQSDKYVPLIVVASYDFVRENQLGGSENLAKREKVIEVINNRIKASLLEFVLILESNQ